MHDANQKRTRFFLSCMAGKGESQGGVGTFYPTIITFRIEQQSRWVFPGPESRVFRDLSYFLLDSCGSSFCFGCVH